MTVIGFGNDERQLLKNIDFSRNLSLDFWMYLEKAPPRWSDIFSIQVNELKNAISVKLRKRRLKIYHGTGERTVVMLEREIPQSALPLNSWIKISIKRRVRSDGLHMDLTFGGHEPIRVKQPKNKNLPYNFPQADRPDVSLLSDVEHVGLISGFHFEGAKGHFVAYDQGQVVSNVGKTLPLKYGVRHISRGNENEGVFIHSLRSLEGNVYQLVEKKTQKRLEIEIAKFLSENQKYDPILRRIFPVIHWMEEDECFLTYLMEYIPGTWDRRRINIVEVFDLVLENLKDLADVGSSYDLTGTLPDTMTAFDTMIPDLRKAPDFKAISGKLDSYLHLRRDLAAHRVVLSHNDIWGANIAVPLESHRSRLIDIGRVSMNFMGADLLHFRRHYSEFGKDSKDERVWQKILHHYSAAFAEDPEHVEIGTVAYAVQREIEGQLRRQERGVQARTDRLVSLLSRLPLDH